MHEPTLCWVVILAELIVALITNAEECSFYMPKLRNTGIITNPSYPYDEHRLIDCQYMFDLEPPHHSRQSMLCITFESFYLPSKSPDECRGNYVKIGLLKPALICGTQNEYVLQRFADDDPLKVEWPTICYIEPRRLSIEVRMGHKIFGYDEGHRFFATYQRFFYPGGYSCDVPRPCDSVCDDSDPDDRCPSCLCHHTIKPEGMVEAVSCDFTRSICGIHHDYYYRWRSAQRYNPEIIVPTDHTYGDFSTNTNAGYFFLAGSYSQSYLLELPSFKMNQSSCFQFWFYMSGRLVDSLEVLLKICDDSKVCGVNRVVWYRQGDEGAVWRLAQILIKPQQNRSFQLQFHGTTLYRSSGDGGGIFLDDISLIPGECPMQRDISCAFNRDLCGWNTSGNIILRHDYATNAGQVQGLFVSATKELRAVLTSPFIIERVRSSRCLKFWYRLVHSLTDMRVQIFVRNFDSSSQKKLLKTLLIDSGGWRWYQLDITSPSFYTYEAYVVEFVFVQFGLDRYVSAAVLMTNVSVWESRCPVVPTIAPTTVKPVCSKDGQLHCMDGGHPGKCIYQNQVCDGVHDCPYGWDEQTERCTCPVGQFRCQRGECIKLEYRCDNIIHCLDGSDESANFARCDSGPVLSVGAIIGSSFGVMCFCVLLVALCAWCCVYAKSRRHTHGHARAPRRSLRLELHHELEPYTLDCPDAPPNYYSVVNVGYEAEPPPSYDSVFGRLNSFREWFSGDRRSSLNSYSNRSDRQSNGAPTYVGPSNAPSVPPIPPRAPMRLNPALLMQNRGESDKSSTETVSVTTEPDVRRPEPDIQRPEPEVRPDVPEAEVERRPETLAAEESVHEPETEIPDPNTMRPDPNTMRPDPNTVRPDQEATRTVSDVSRSSNQEPDVDDSLPEMSRQPSWRLEVAWRLSDSDSRRPVVDDVAGLETSEV